MRILRPLSLGYRLRGVAIDEGFSAAVIWLLFCRGIVLPTEQTALLLEATPRMDFLQHTDRRILDMGNPYEDLAKQVHEQVDKQGLTAAYHTLTESFAQSVSTLTFKEKQEAWTQCKQAMDLEDKGLLPKMGSAFLIQNAAVLDQSDGKKDGLIHRRSLENAVSQCVNPLYKELETQALAQFDVAANLHQKDDIIDSRELQSFTDRQTMPSVEKFTAKAVDSVFGLLNKSPQDAASGLQSSLSTRWAMETSDERQATWKSVRAALEERDPNIIGKLSMCWMSNNIQYIDRDRKDANSPIAVTYNELTPFAKSEFGLARDMATYIQAKFQDIAPVEGYNKLDEISGTEIKIYQSKMFKK